MRLISVVLIALAMTPAFSNATSNFNVDSVHCSGTETSSFGAVMTLSCTGNLLLIGEVISPVGMLKLRNVFTPPSNDDFVPSPNDWFLQAPTDEIVPSPNDWLLPFLTGTPLKNGAPTSIAGGSISIGTHGFTSISLLSVENPPCISWDSVQLIGGGTITILSAVPEPSAWASMLAGLLLLGGFLQMKKRRNT